MTSVKERLRRLADELMTSAPKPPASLPDLSKLVLPIIRRERVVGGEPLRRNIDYQSTARKTLLVDGPYCSKCGMLQEPDIEHGDDECAVAAVMLS